MNKKVKSESIGNESEIRASRVRNEGKMVIWKVDRE